MGPTATLLIEFTPLYSFAHRPLIEFARLLIEFTPANSINRVAAD
jgi:adenosylmethionine-8-amino-7-oxononanoate aminotransferase